MIHTRIFNRMANTAAVMLTDRRKDFRAISPPLLLSQVPRAQHGRYTMTLRSSGCNAVFSGWRGSAISIINHGYKNQTPALSSCIRAMQPGCCRWELERTIASIPATVWTSGLNGHWGHGECSVKNGGMIAPHFNTRARDLMPLDWEFVGHPGYRFDVAKNALLIYRLSIGGAMQTCFKWCCRGLTPSLLILIKSWW